MYQGQTVFSQVVGFLPQKKFRQCVNRYNGNFRVRSFTCYDQFLCMAIAQLAYRESLRDIECCLRAMREKLYHMGIRYPDLYNYNQHSGKYRQICSNQLKSKR